MSARTRCRVRRSGGVWLAPVGVAMIAVIAMVGPVGAQSFVNFESGHVRPLALSLDGARLFAVNTPDNRLEVFDVGVGSLTRVGEVPVGMEPVAVAVRTASEVWVVNHLSDSISVVDVSNPALPRVTATLNVGDEPRDIVFARADRSRAYVTAAHRGQNRPGDPQLTTEGVGRADVWVFDATNLAAPPAILQLFADTPRALAVSPDGSTVWAAAFHSGNQTTAITEALVTAPAGLGLPPPNPTPVPGLPARPNTGLIVKWDGTKWADEISRDWSAKVLFNLPDHDVFRIDATATTPTVTGTIDHVGTILFNMAVNPVTGRLHVANLEARNQIRFEPVIKGHIAENRITVVNGTTPTARHINPHINYAVTPGSAGEIAQSLAFPLGMVFSSDATRLYVAGFGSAKVGVFTPSNLEGAGTVVKSLIPVGGGPTGLALDEARSQLYVMNRFDRNISIVDTASLSQVATASLRFDAEPTAIRNGRRFLYDAASTSGHGDSACASCHIFGDLDSLAWDLGDPTGAMESNPNPFPIIGSPQAFHPMKGPMTTQSLRGMAGLGSMHWRGDRNGGAGDPLNEDLSFKAFNPAFVGLLGRSSQLTAAEMQSFTDFILTVVYPPNPIANLDGTATAAQAAGFTSMTTGLTDGVATCAGCHTLPFGSSGFSTFENEPQVFKVAHFRNVYQKVGMFGSAAPLAGGGLPDPFLGDQVRGFGLLHDGSIATVFNFLNAPVFFLSNTDRRNLEQFILAIDTGLAPAVGQQITINSATWNAGTSITRINLFLGRADVAPPVDCDVIVKGNIAGQARGGRYLGGGTWATDRAAEGTLTTSQVRQLAQTVGQEMTFTCVPPGSGVRMGVDRDLDGFRDRDEIDAGTDPANPASFPSGPTPTPTATPGGTPTATPTVTPGGPPVTAIRGSSLTMITDESPPINPDAKRFSFRSGPYRGWPSGVTAPAPFTIGDPTIGGGRLAVFNPATNELAAALLPASGWKRSGSSASPRYRYSDAKGLHGPVRAASLQNGRLTIRLRGAAWTYTLEEASQSSLALHLSLAGGATTYCALMPARVNGVGSSFPYDHVGKFVGQRNTPPPVFCPLEPDGGGGGSPSRAFVSAADGRGGLLD